MDSRFSINRSKVNRKGEAPITLRVSTDGNEYQIATGLRCKSEAWNQRDQRVSQKDGQTNRNELNRKLKERKETIEKAWYAIEGNGFEVTQAMLKSKFDEFLGIMPRGAKSKMTKKEFLESLVRSMIKDNPQWSEGYSRRMISPLRKLLEYDPSFVIEKLDSDYFKQYAQWCFVDRGNGDNAVNKDAKILRVSLHYCRKIGLKVTDDIDGVKWRSSHTEIISLTEAEVKKIADLDLSLKSKSMRQARDMFLISSYTGLRWSDVVSLKKWNITLDKDPEHNDWGIYKSTMQKVQKAISVPVKPEAMAILEHYGWQFSKINLQNVNKQIKVIGEMAEIKEETKKSKSVNYQTIETPVLRYELITFHVARHSFALIYLNKFESPGMMEGKYLQGLMGHSSIDVSMKYVGISENAKNKSYKDAFS